MKCNEPKFSPAHFHLRVELADLLAVEPHGVASARETAQRNIRLERLEHLDANFIRVHHRINLDLNPVFRIGRFDVGSQFVARSGQVALQIQSHLNRITFQRQDLSGVNENISAR